MEMDVAVFEGMKTVPLTVHILFDKVVTPLGIHPDRDGM